MNCPYCSDSSQVIEVGKPTVDFIIGHALALGVGPLTAALAAPLVAQYRLFGKRVYKCTKCNMYFIA